MNKPTTTPYVAGRHERVREVLRRNNALLLWSQRGPGKADFTIECWAVKKGAPLLLQLFDEGGVDAYFSSPEFEMEPFLAELDRYARGE